MSDVDIAVPQNDRGLFDIDIDPDTGDFLLVDTFDTALSMSLFSERRADQGEIPAAQLRRGWWGNLVGPQDFEIGSKLWLLDQARKTQETLNAAVDHAKAGLQWLVDDGHLISVDVSGEFTDTGIRLTIRLNRSNSPTESRSFDLWTNTERANGV